MTALEALEARELEKPGLAAARLVMQKAENEVRKFYAGIEDDVTPEEIARVMALKGRQALAAYRAEQAAGLRNNTNNLFPGLKARVIGDRMMWRAGIYFKDETYAFKEDKAINGDPSWIMDLPDGLFDEMSETHMRFNSRTTVDNRGQIIGCGDPLRVSRNSVVWVRGDDGTFWQNPDLSPEGFPKEHLGADDVMLGLGALTLRT